MVKFLNTKGLSEWIPRLIMEAEHEVVILAPYIQTSEFLFKALKDADRRGVELLIVYREEKLNEIEKEKLLSIQNLNLLHHPNLHAKCYMNENHIIIASMNMYEYSEKNNREMGLLINRSEYGQTEQSHRNRYLNKQLDEAKELLDDIIPEIQAIVNGSHLERPSKETLLEGFEFDILKTNKELIEDMCLKLSDTFIHKKFQPIQIDGDYFPFCKNFIDHLDLTIEHKRFVFKFNYPLDRLKQIYSRFRPNYDEFVIQNFKLYWNNYDDPFYLYTNKESALWHDHEEIENNHILLKKGFHDLRLLLKKFV
jgi:sugar-specific transcriptional regulator TrmB